MSCVPKGGEFGRGDGFDRSRFGDFRSCSGVCGLVELAVVRSSLRSMCLSGLGAIRNAPGRCRPKQVSVVSGDAAGGVKLF